MVHKVLGHPYGWTNNGEGKGMIILMRGSKPGFEPARRYVQVGRCYRPGICFPRAVLKRVTFGGKPFRKPR